MLVLHDPSGLVAARRPIMGSMADALDKMAAAMIATFQYGRASIAGPGRP
jgi:hypothetical protein